MNWRTHNIKNIKGKYLFKFIPRKHLEDFLSTGNIWFSRADKFGDKLECVTINDLKKKEIDMDLVENRKKQHLISCFHEANNETLAFWDTYSKNEEDRRIYAIKFNREELCNKIISSHIPIASHKIEKQIHGKVIYKNLLTTRKLQPVKEISLRKEYAFSYEREYRFIIKTRIKNIVPEKGININIGNLDELSFQILVNPLLEDEAYIKALEFLEEKSVYKKFKITRITKFFKPELGS